MLPTVDFCGKKVTRFISGGNPISGFSHFSPELDQEMIDFFTGANTVKYLHECKRQGMNTFQTRGDRHTMRLVHEYRQDGGDLQWIVQTASELRDLPGNVRQIAGCKPIGIYIHGTWVDNKWHEGEMDDVRDLLKCIHDQGLPAGVASHQPRVIEYLDEHDWEMDFFMTCFYNLARGYKGAPAEDKAKLKEGKETFLPEDPVAMTEVIKKVSRPCIAFKIMGAGRTCGTPEEVRKSFQFAFDNIKPGDLVNVGMFNGRKNQVAENAAIVRDILGVKEEVGAD